MMPPAGSQRPDYESVFNVAPGNYLLLDPDFRIVGVTDAYLAATMTTRAAILDRGLFDVFPDNPDDPAADGVRNLRASLLRVLAIRQPDRMAVQKYDIRRPEAEGGGFEERYWSPLNIPVLGADGSVRHIIHWVEDVTPVIRLKQEMQREQQVLYEELRLQATKIEAETFLRAEAIDANKRLTESERRYRFLADAVPQLIWTADPGGQLDYCNERWCGFTNLPVEQLHGDGWQQALHPEDHASTVAAWAEAVRTGTSRYQVEHRLRYRDGTWRWMLTTALPYYDGDGRIRRWFGTTTDIHERVVADEQARQTQRLQAAGQLAGGLAHEVNNMLAAVLGFGELTLAALGPDHPQYADVDEIVKAGARAAEVTRQVLAFSRRQVLRPVVLDLHAVVAELGPVLRRLLGSDRRLDIKAARSDVRAVADRSQVEQVLVNLVANARDATTTNSVITIETDVVSLDRAALGEQGEHATSSERFARLTVRDDGVGMPAEVVARAFEPFFTTKTVGQGTGLGLSTVYGIVKQSGGDIRIESAPGAGTAVSVYLPLADAEPALVQEAKTVVRGRGERVLVVEDEPVMRSVLRRMLEALGYQVYHAPNGAAALEFLEAHQGEVDLLLTDIVMPRMNGRQLIGEAQARYPGLPLLVMSAYRSDDIVERGLTTADTPFLAKPFTLEKLATAVRDGLDSSGSRPT